MSFRTTFSKRIFLLLVSFHFFFITIVSIESSWRSIFEFFNGKEKGISNSSYKLVNSIRTGSLVRYYTTFTGLDTGYGFFAPNVASICYLEFEVYNEDMLVQKVLFPQFKNRESFSRYSTLLGRFQEKIYYSFLKKEKTEYINYLDVIIRSMAHNVLSKFAVANRVKANLYLFKYPTLDEYRNGFRVSESILLESYDVIKR